MPAWATTAAPPPIPALSSGFTVLESCVFSTAKRFLDRGITANTFQGRINMGQCVAVTFFGLLVEGN